MSDWKKSSFLNDNACCSENLMPHSQNLGVLESCHPYRIRIRSQNYCLVRAYPSCFSGRVVNQAEAPVSWFKSLVRICSELMCEPMTSILCLFCSTLAAWILFLMAWIYSSGWRFSSFFFFYIYNLHFFEQKIYSHQVLMYLNVPGIPVKKSLQNRQIDSWRTTGCVSLGVICASLLTGRHLLMNKKDKNSRYTNIKIMII